MCGRSSIASLWDLPCVPIPRVCVHKAMCPGAVGSLQEAMRVSQGMVLVSPSQRGADVLGGEGTVLEGESFK